MANADLHDTHTPTIGAKAKPNPSTSAALSTSSQPPILPSNLPLMAGSEVAFDATSTHCIYRLNLKFPGNVEVGPFRPPPTHRTFLVELHELSRRF
jgi:hypothetical protein